MINDLIKKGDAYMTNEEIVRTLKAIENYWTSVRNRSTFEYRYLAEGKVIAYRDAIQLLTDNDYAQHMHDNIDFLN